MRNKKILLTAFVFLIVIAPVSLAQSSFPKPVGYVNDFAGILPDAGVIDATLAEYERNTTIEIAVVTLESLPEDQTAASYAVELFQDWGIGKKGEDNGILVLIVKDGKSGNRMRIELGYGIQGYVTGAEAGRILDDALPSYESGDYESAVVIILTGLSDQLENYVPGDYFPEPDYEELIRTMLPTIIFFVVVVVALVANLMPQKCEYCKGKMECHGNVCVCTKCGRRARRKDRSWMLFLPLLFGGRGGGGGFGGFGGGVSGGGGAGR